MKKTVEIGKKILSANEEYAKKNLDFLAENKSLCFNVISSPGAGKTTLLAKTITDIKDKLNIGVIEGDIKTDIDAERIRATSAPAVQIETGGACHLSALQVNQALQQFDVAALDMIFIENVGNLVCPSSFELGENGKIVVLSVAEGDDKPVKYPGTFAKAKVMLINKIDLLSAGVVDFSIERAINDAKTLNKDIRVFPISAKTGEGLRQWYDWLEDSAKGI
jgi:hydrogenase nickel incorporation protein HypB